MAVASALERVRHAPTILDAMRRRTDVIRTTHQALHDGARASDVLDPILDAIASASDTVTALTAIHALARVPGAAAQNALSEIILDAGTGFGEHAVWASRHRGADPYLITLVARAAMRGGIIALHAQRAMAHWAGDEPLVVIAAQERLLDETEPDRARAHLIETIGLLPGRAARMTLQRVACDTNEGDLARSSAIAAFAERAQERLPQAIGALARESGRLGEAVRSVRAHRRLIRRGLRRPDEPYPGHGFSGRCLSRGPRIVEVSEHGHHRR